MTRAKTAKEKVELINSKINHIEQYVEEFNIQSTSINKLKARLESLQSLRVDFKAAIENVEEADKSLLPEDILKQRIEFEDKLCDAIASINDIVDKAIADAAAIAASAAGTGPASAAPSNSRDSFQINLPTLNLKSFSGNYKEWLSFENSFKSVISENTTLNNLQKFQYLKSCLTEEAFRSIQTLELKEETYSEAWKILEKRFKQSWLIGQDHIHYTQF
jgi:hypothetical protein